MDLNALSALTTSGQQASNQKTIAGNFDSFLQLLTTQLKNQNPLEPLDTNEFTAQLVQFSSVEQSIKTNASLDRLLALQNASALTGIVGYIGQTVEAEGATTKLENGNAQWTINSSAQSDTAEVTIRNSAGQIVAIQPIELSQGDNTFTWNGQTTGGSLAPEGEYTISVEANTAAGNRIEVSTLVSGVVDGIDMSGNDPLLRIGNMTIKLSAIRSVSRSL